ncbi:Adenosine receptor A2a [Stylophora pistillata]|uniref:Adenosine receptor A2a n=1 Tax=Stylophora pistillata TaxID=50429 RepID=A0A2B4SR05_STYPI|nr:Adenosine receptor A2a [Stylophora pistillata]
MLLRNENKRIFKADYPFTRKPLQAYKVMHLDQVSEIEAFSEITSLLGHVSLIASVSNMFGVTVERLISIRFPLKYDLLETKLRAKVSMVCIWTFSSSYGTVWSLDLAPIQYMAIYFVLVLVGTTSIYFYIFLIARRLEGGTVHIQGESTNAQIPNRRRERKAAKTIAIIVGVAVLCWLPLLIIPNVFPKDLDNATVVKIVYPLRILSVCNSSINPYIYCVRSSRYSVAFIKLLGLQKPLKGKVQAKHIEGLSVCRTQGDVPKSEIQAPQEDIKDIAL